MSSVHSQCKVDIKSQALALGASACGFAEAKPVDANAEAIYDRWVADGCNGQMQYCAKYREQRNDPRLLLESAKSLIVCAFNYYNADNPAPLSRQIARYAWGDDYHWAVKSRLNALGAYIVDKYGGECRACVDTAPIRERYWAQQSGIGYIGVNNQLIVPGIGSHVFLGILLWTGEAEADKPCESRCRECMACVKACPNHALDGQGCCDARKCVSYLTIEHGGDLPSGIGLGGYIYGCDICQRVCPENALAQPTELPEFQANDSLLSLTLDDVMAMTPSHYKKLTKKSAMQRVTLHQLHRNISYVTPNKK